MAILRTFVTDVESMEKALENRAIQDNKDKLFVSTYDKELKRNTL